jgi:hypothetical protein
VSSNRLGDAMTAVYNLISASPALSGVTVTLGLSPTAAMDSEFVIVGHDGTLNADGSLSENSEAGTFTMAFIVMGQAPLQQETGQVRIVAMSQTGDSGDLAGRITEAERVLAACTDAVAGQKATDILFDTAAPGRLLTRQAGQGAVAGFAFTIGYTAPW